MNTILILYYNTTITLLYCTVRDPASAVDTLSLSHALFLSLCTICILQSVQLYTYKSHLLYIDTCRAMCVCVCVHLQTVT